MEPSVKKTAHFAVTAGLCTSLVLSGVPVEALAAEVESHQMEAAAAQLRSDEVTATEDVVAATAFADAADPAVTGVDDPAATTGDAASQGATTEGTDGSTDSSSQTPDTPAPDTSTPGSDQAADQGVDQSSGQTPDGDDPADTTTEAATDAAEPAADAAGEPTDAEPAAEDDATLGAVTMTQEGGEALQCDSISAAIEAASAYSSTNKALYTIVLNQDMQEDVVLPADKKIAIDLNGHKLTNVWNHTIVSHAKYNSVEIKDSKGGGIVDNTSHAKAAVYVDAKAQLKLSGGTYMRSAEASKSENDNGGNSYYVLKNYGTLTVNDGVTVKFSDTNPGLYSSLVASGWQDAAAAEAGTNGEPKPSAGGNKATLAINGGTFIGGQITVKNDDYGVLKVKGGTIKQPSENRYALVNFNDATITGGSIEAVGSAVLSQKIGAPNKGTLAISSGSITSASRSALVLKNGAAATITGGTFTTESGAEKINIADDASTATVTGGTFVGAGAVSNKDDVFAEGYGAVDDGKGNVTVGVTTPQVVVIDKDGVETSYAQAKDAFKAAPAGSTIKLQKDLVAGEWGYETSAFGVTIDLNGHNIDGTAAVKNGGRVLYLHTKSSTKPVDGVANTVSIVNNASGGGTITGVLPVEAGCGNSKYELPVAVGDGVTLVSTSTDPSANSIKLSSSAYVQYSDATAAYFKSGGFKVSAEDGDRIYGACANAASVAAGENPTVHLMNDYQTVEPIRSGSKTVTLDLGGHTYTYTSAKNQVVEVNHKNVTLTIANGKLVATDEGPNGIEVGYDGAGIVLDGVAVEVPGDVYGIVTNGTKKDNSVVLKNSTLNVPNGQGIYFPSSGSVEIVNSIITAKHNGVQMCAGDLTISGKDTKITVTGTPEDKTESDGGIADGAAISIVNREGYKGVGDVRIEDGTFTAASGVDAVKAYSFDNDSNTESDWADASESVDISGGTFSHVPDNMGDLCGEGYEPVMDPETGSTTVEVPEAERVAEINGRAYPTLQEALDATQDGQTVTLLKDVTENIVVAEGTNAVLDLNGCTLSGGTVSGKAALTNYGTVTVRDSSADAQGRIIREDNGVPAYYVIDNQGVMNFESGIVYNNAGNRNGAGASLVRNAGAGKEAHLKISGGRFEQENFIVIKNDDLGVFEMTGGAIVTSKRDGKFLSSAVQNWGTATLSGGELTGAIWTSVWDSKLPASRTVIEGSVIIDGEITADRYDGSVATTPRVEITGGTIKNKENGFTIDAGAELVISGGSFDAPVDVKYCAPNYGPVRQPDGSYGVSTEQSYTVRHLFEKVDSDEYAEDANLAQSETLTGTIGEDTAAQVKDIDGFTAEKVEQQKISADGKTVVEIKYTRVRHTITFDLKGGIGEDRTQVKKHGAKPTVYKDPTKEGCEFLGWYIAGTLNKFDFNDPVTSDLQLVAQWRVKSYTVTLDTNGGEPLDDLAIDHGEQITQLMATRAGYTLTGWTDADGNAVKFPITVTSELALTAQWKLDAPAVNITADMSDEDAHAGDTVILTANPSHALPGVTYTYQWYKGRKKIEGATEKTLEVTKDGEYTVDVVAHDGKSESAAATSNSITLAFEKHDVMLAFAHDEVEKHANEIGDAFTNGLTVQVRALGAVVYASDNEDVATVDPATGEVTIKGVGEAVITAQIAETDTHEAAEASYKLTVTDHDSGTWQTVKAPTCTEAGSEQRVCEVCGEVLEAREIAAKGHEDGVWVVTREATCTEAGERELHCATCGEVIKTEAIPAAGHKSGEWETVKAPTCTEAGVEQRVCEVCGEVLETREIPAKGHKDGVWVVTKEATCTEPGEKELHCATCDAVIKTEAITATGHAVTRVPAQDATCTEQGVIEYWTCGTCGKLFADEACTVEMSQADTVAPALGHKLEAVDEAPATCETPGVKAHYACATCGELFLDAEGEQPADEDALAIPALGHKLEQVVAVAPTIDKEGVKAHYRCAVCGELYWDAEGTKKVEHADDLIVEKLEAVTVTFDDCIDPKDDQVSVRLEKGGVLSPDDIPADPSYEGYTFLGWFLFDEATQTWGEQFDPEAPVTHDVLVGAKWQKNDDGSDGGATQTPSDKPSTPAKKPSSKPDDAGKETLVQTGDSAFAQVAAAFTAGVAALFTGLGLHRRRED